MTQLQRRRPNSELQLPSHLAPILKRVYSRRPLESAHELELGLENLLPPDRLLGMECAVDLLVAALERQDSLLIVSDFDADGATSCVLAMKALECFGFRQVDYIVPNRFEYGYGLTPEIVQLALIREPDLIITVDNGISSIEGVRAARDAGVRTLITDHHLPGAELPVADAIINPNQPGCNFPSKALAGVGVIFYLMLALRARLRESGYFAKHAVAEPNMADSLDLVALGTVADVVPLDHNNRILVDEGLKRIRAGRMRPGFRALAQIAGRDPSRITSADLGFAVGPRLNAAGRLDDMSTGIECLLATDPGCAHQLAMQLDTMNKDRRQIESTMRDQAFAYLEELVVEEDCLPAALCLYDERWHQGVVGILASRIKDRFHRPAIAFAKADEDSDSLSSAILLKGSARSIRGFHIRDALDAVAAHNPGLISRFGGHAMAAGLSLPAASLEAFTLAFEAEASRLLHETDLQATVLSDGELEIAELNLETAELLQDSGPWGQEFPEPVFDGRFLIRDCKRLGENHLKLVLAPATAPRLNVEAIAFNVAAEQWPDEQAEAIEIAYRLAVNEYRGMRSLQLVVESFLAS